MASPEIYIDEAQQRHRCSGRMACGPRASAGPSAEQRRAAWVKQRGYAQFTQAAESRDGLTFQARPAITRQSYLRVFPYQGPLLRDGETRTTAAEHRGRSTPSSSAAVRFAIHRTPAECVT